MAGVFPSDTESLITCDLSANVAGNVAQSLYKTISSGRTGMNRDGSVYKEYQSDNEVYRITVKSNFQESIITIEPKPGPGWNKNVLIEAAKMVKQLMKDAGEDEPMVELGVQNQQQLNDVLLQVSGPEAVLENFLGNVSRVTVNSDSSELDEKGIREKMNEVVKNEAAKFQNDLNTTKDDIEKAVSQVNALITKLLQDNDITPQSDYSGVVFGEEEVRKKSPALFKELKILKDFRNELNSNLETFQGVFDSQNPDKAQIIGVVIANFDAAVNIVEKKTGALPPTTWSKTFDNILISIKKCLGLLAKDKQLHKAESHDLITKLTSNNSLSRPLTLYRALHQKKEAEVNKNGTTTETNPHARPSKPKPSQG